MPLAKHLKELNHNIKGSTVDKTKLKDITKIGVQAFCINLAPQINEDFNVDFFDSETIIINFPPKRVANIESLYPAQVESLVKLIEISTIKNIIFISSTSVYRNSNKEIDERCNLDPEKASGLALRKAEAIISNISDTKCTILRFGGLIGYDRMPGRFLSGKKNLKNGNTPVNLIHQDDCIGIIEIIIRKNLWGKTYNACSPIHPTRKEFYDKAADLIGMDKPIFNDINDSFKIISAKKIVDDSGYKFKFLSPLDTITK